MAAQQAQVAVGQREDAPVQPEALAGEPVGERRLRRQPGEVGGAFGDVGGEFAAVQAGEFGALAVEVVEQGRVGRAVEHGVGGQAGVAEQVAGEACLQGFAVHAPPWQISQNGVPFSAASFSTVADGP